MKPPLIDNVIAPPEQFTDTVRVRSNCLYFVRSPLGFWLALYPKFFLFFFFLFFSFLSLVFGNFTVSPQYWAELY